MKRIVLSLVFVLSFIPGFAGGVDYLSNQSAGFLMNPARTASTDRADIVLYNPAGTVLMGRGFFIDVSSQFWTKENKQDASGLTLLATTIEEDYSDDKIVPVVPNLSMVYNFGKVGVYGNVGMIGGGGENHWNSNSGVLKDAFLISALVYSSTGYADIPSGTQGDVEASEYIYGLGTGLAFSFFKNIVSLSAGVRYVSSELQYERHVDASFYNSYYGNWSLNQDYAFTSDADGFTPILGLDIKLSKRLNIGYRFEGETDLEYKYNLDENSCTNSFPTAAQSTINSTVISDGEEVDGKKENRNLPRIHSIGMEYILNSLITFSASATVYFTGDSDMDGGEEYFDKGYDLAGGITFRPSKDVKICTGLMYTETGAKDSLYENIDNISSLSTDPLFDSIMCGMGLVYTAWPNVDFTFAAAYKYFFPVDATVSEPTYPLNMDIHYEKQEFMFGFGVSCRSQLDNTRREKKETFRFRYPEEKS